MKKTERIKQAIILHSKDTFTIKEIHAKIKQYGVSEHHLATFVSKAVKKGNYHKVTTTGRGWGRAVTYSRVPVDKTKQLKQTKLQLKEPEVIPDNLPLEVIGEAILSSFKLLKSQLFKAQERIEKLTQECTRLRKDTVDLKKSLELKQKELDTVGDALRKRTGKTFPMSEVAKVIRNGCLVVGESPGQS